MENKLVIENENNKLITVFIEPWCYEYYLKRSDTLTLVQRPNLVGYYHQKVEPYEDGILITLYVEGGYDEPSVFLNNSLIKPFNEK